MSIETQTTTDALTRLTLPVYRRLFDEDSEFVATLESKLLEARIGREVDRYLARALAAGLGLGAVLWLIGTALGYVLFATGVIDVGVLLVQSVPNETLADLLTRLRIPALVGTTGLLGGTVGVAIGFGAFIAWPYLQASEREREINLLLPDAISFMYALSAGGLNQLEIIEAMANAEDTYGEVAVEFQNIRKEAEYFDTDYRTAIRNQALVSPSDELGQFLTDMLSIISSGGDMESFLDDKKDTHMRTAKQQQEQTLETLELFGEMYMTLSLFPLLLIIVLVVMQMVGQAQTTLLYGTVYALIPLTGAAFLVLISTVKQDDPGDGYLEHPSVDAAHSEIKTPLSAGVAERFDGPLFKQIQSRERLHRAREILAAPQAFFREQPLYTLAITVPLAVVAVGLAVVTGAAPTQWNSLAGDGLVSQPVWGTFLYAYVPLYVIATPVAVFYEWNVRARRGITNGLSENLRKLASANETGQTLLESFRTVSATGSGALTREFRTLHTKVNYGMSLEGALVEFNNTYHLPRLARTVKLISKAQEASDQITSVLQTAARASENQDALERDRKSRTRMQVVIIMMTFLTLLAVMAILQSQFLGVMGDLVGGGGGSLEAQAGFGVGNIDTQLLSLLFFHAVTLHAILSGLIAGYMRDAQLLSGLKYVIVLSTIALAVWLFV